MQYLKAALTLLAYTASWASLWVLCHLTTAVTAGATGLIPWAWLLWSNDRLDPTISTVGFVVLTICAVCLACLTALPLAGALARFALRSFPIRLGESMSSLLPRLLLAAMFCIYLFWNTVGQSALTNLTALDDDKPEDLLRGLIYLCMYGGLTAMWVAAVSTALAAHVRNSMGPARPYLLYLRKFSSFADRALTPEIIRATPPNLQVVLIASPGNAPANWDFLTWAFAGLRVFHPLRDYPLHFQTTDLWWARNVETLVNGARCIVIDQSEKSGSMQIEANILSRIKGHHRVVRLHLACTVSHVAENDVPTVALLAIPYRKTYLAAIPRIVAQLAIVAAAGYFLIAYDFGLLILPPLATIGWPFSLILVLYAAPFVFRPSIAPADLGEIRSAIAASATTQAIDERNLDPVLKALGQ